MGMRIEIGREGGSGMREGERERERKRDFAS